MTVRTRFAPSPTGYLHIGGVRTALFNWLFARKHGGQFILRIDDTDQQRNVEAALAPILDGFRWLGLDWDEGAEVGGPFGPYYQSAKLNRYREAVGQLVASGHAYWDYASPEEFKAEMEAAEREKRPKIYSRRWMAQTAADRVRFESQGRVGSVRLKMPREGVCRFFDHIRGEMCIEWANEQDIVIQRSDGSVTYNLANVVDDFDMKITHVIRAEEHLSNTPRQIFMLEALGYPRPEYAHVPFVAEPGSKNKLSKRKIAQYLKNPDFKKVYEHGKSLADRLGLSATPETFNPVLVEFYEQVGYLPDAVINYLLLLGWSWDGSTEFFTRAEMIEKFSLDRVNKAAASLDVKKLWAFQERYFVGLDLDEKVRRVVPFLERAGLSAPVDLVRCVVEHAAHRLVVAGDILQYDDFFLPDEAIHYQAQAIQKHIHSARALLPKLRAVLVNASAFEAAVLRSEVEALAQEIGVKPGVLSQTLRVAVTGKEVGFDAYATLALLGRERCLKRFDRAVAERPPG
jgi:glutamyl-tRNA synthetase